MCKLLNEKNWISGTNGTKGCGIQNNKQPENIKETSKDITQNQIKPENSQKKTEEISSRIKEETKIESENHKTKEE